MADEKLRRSKPSSRRSGHSESIDYSFNDKAGGLKVVGPIMGSMVPLGAANSKLAVGAGAVVALYNNDTAVHWLDVGKSSVSSTAVGATAIALPPGQYTTISTGDNTHIIADSSKVFAYLIEDDTIYSPS